MTNWPHAPIHRLVEKGAYIVTAGTYQKQHHLNSASRLEMMQSLLFEYAAEYGWRLQAWAIMSNHYHFIAASPDDPASLKKFLSKLHTKSAIELNRADNAVGRKVWYQYWDSHITYQTSYYARLKYVHQNAVHHGLVSLAEDYPWCSASWFARSAKKSFVRTINSFNTQKLNIDDDFEVLKPT